MFSKKDSSIGNTGASLSGYLKKARNTNRLLGLFGILGLLGFIGFWSYSNDGTVYPFVFFSFFGFFAYFYEGRLPNPKKEELVESSRAKAIAKTYKISSYLIMFVLFFIGVISTWLSHEYTLIIVTVSLSIVIAISMILKSYFTLRYYAIGTENNK